MLRPTLSGIGLLITASLLPNAADAQTWRNSRTPIFGQRSVRGFNVPQYRPYGAPQFGSRVAGRNPARNCAAEAQRAYQECVRTAPSQSGRCAYIANRMLQQCIREQQEGAQQSRLYYQGITPGRATQRVAPTRPSQFRYAPSGIGGQVFSRQR